MYNCLVIAVSLTRDLHYMHLHIYRQQSNRRKERKIYKREITEDEEVVAGGLMSGTQVQTII